MTIEELKQCKKCSLASTRKKVVVGEGCKEPKIFFIGEAPGANENDLGRPFVGRSGQLLRESLKKAGIEPTKCFITNLIKCRPPNNRKPKRDELDSCRKWLDKQIENMNPKIICLLGGFPLKEILSESGIMKSRGTWREKDGRRYFIALHPAAVLRGLISRDEYVLSFEVLKKGLE